MAEYDRVFAKQLVKEVERHPILYDANYPEYKDRFKVDLEWAAVGLAMNQTSDVVRKKWQNLRGSYSRALSSRIKAGPNCSHKKRAVFYLEKEMDFLRDHMSQGTMIEGSSMLEPDDNCDSKEVVSGDVLSFGGEEDIESESEEELVSHYVPPKKKKRNLCAVKESSRAVNFTYGERRKERSDTDLDFFKGLLPQVKELSKVYKRDFFYKVYNILYETLCQQDADVAISEVTDHKV
ncbi:uncharacterized protein LOC101853143 [Aplysia californica]|uniref:Uncharacterized protein LOC101853143 n=1 Tax=Aplysia californica TaxID=6500 RepID=A0ABM0JG99_APLCA|nr:uncharacterized protein LOC101853143 [Aplysia californica]